MERHLKDTAASVHQRLLNKARTSLRPFNELLQFFAIERFIYRLSQSSYADRFILKGALMLSVWGDQASHPTMDIDLLGSMDRSLEWTTSAIRAVCLMDVETDGMSFDPDAITATRITEEAEYEGVRVRIHGSLGNARVPLQIDIGFGDVIVPGPCQVIYPVLLDFPPPTMQGYTMESAIAEKFEAMVKRGVLNSRMKDFYDIWMLSNTFDFRGEVLSRAVETTFTNRNTRITPDPAVFDPLFGVAPDKMVQWQGFVKKARLTNAPGVFSEVVGTVNVFLEPLVTAIIERRPFSNTWDAPGPWR